jgi:hypothetical protein
VASDQSNWCITRRRNNAQVLCARGVVLPKQHGWCVAAPTTPNAATPLRLGRVSLQRRSAAAVTAAPDQKQSRPSQSQSQPTPTRVRVAHDGSIRASRLAFWGLLQTELRQLGGDDEGLKDAVSLLASLESIYG